MNKQEDRTIRRIKYAVKIIRKNSDLTHLRALDSFAKDQGFKDHKSLMWTHNKKPDSPLIQNAFAAAEKIIAKAKEGKQHET